LRIDTIKPKTLIAVIFLIFLISIASIEYVELNNKPVTYSPVVEKICFSKTNYSYGQCIPIYFNATIKGNAILNNLGAGSTIVLSYIGNNSLEASKNVTNFNQNPYQNLTNFVPASPDLGYNPPRYATVQFGNTNKITSYEVKWHQNVTASNQTEIKSGYYRIGIEDISSGASKIGMYYLSSNHEYIHIYKKNMTRTSIINHFTRSHLQKISSSYEYFFHSENCIIMEVHSNRYERFTGGYITDRERL
jgi:hypothetical protein